MATALRTCTASLREDAEITGKATAALKERFKAFSKAVSVGGTAGTLQFLKVPRCEGTVTIIYSRGKARPGYELKLTASWQVTSEDGSVLGKGKLLMEEGDETDLGEHEFEVTGSDGGAVADCKRAVKGALGDVNGLMSEWFESLKSL